MQKVQLEGAKAMLIVLRVDAMTELNKKSEEFTHGIFGSEHHEKLTAVKSVFGVPIGFSVDLKDCRAEIVALRDDEFIMFRGQPL